MWVFRQSTDTLRQSKYQEPRQAAQVLVASELSKQRGETGGHWTEHKTGDACCELREERAGAHRSSGNQTCTHTQRHIHTSSFPPVFDPAHKKAGKERWQSCPPRATSQAPASNARVPSTADRLPAAAQSPATSALPLGLRIPSTLSYAACRTRSRRGETT